MRNYIKPGESLAIVAPRNLKPGEFVKVGALSGVAQGAALAGEEVTIVRKGVFVLPKLLAQAWSLGAAIYWDAAESECTTVDAGNELIGAVAVPAADPSETGQVLLDGVIR